MRALVVYESMYGNSHAVAEAIGRGLGDGTIAVVPAAEATARLLAHADLVVVGGPTHAHGMSRQATRQAAIEAARKPDAAVALEPRAEGPGLREWLDSLGAGSGTRAAAFDTRLHWPALVTGRASKGFVKLLRRHGFRLVAPPESFFVTRDNRLEPGEEVRAEQWGRQLIADAEAA